jgi:hypothetical protein
MKHALSLSIDTVNILATKDHAPPLQQGGYHAFLSITNPKLCFEFWCTLA